MDVREIAMKEYEIACQVIEDHSRRMLAVKSWSITLAAAGIAASTQLQSDAILLLVSCSAAAFWVLEAGIRAFQRPFTLRARELEKFLSANEDPTFKAPWLSHNYSQSPKTLNALASAFLPHVLIPNALIGVAGFLWLTANGFIPRLLATLVAH